MRKWCHQPQGLFYIVIHKSEKRVQLFKNYTKPEVGRIYYDVISLY